MYRIFLFTLPLLIFSCTPPSPTSSEGITFSLDGFETVDIPGTNSVWAVRKAPNGISIEEGTLSNGKREGQWIIYHEDGKQIPQSITSYVNGLLNGAQTEYNSRGGITVMRHYINEVLHGSTIEYKNGRLIKVANYNMGQLDGPQLSYYERSDQVQSEANFLNGVQHGPYRYFNEDGAVVLDYQYENGEKIAGGPVEQE